MKKLKKALKAGTKVEMEHTKNKKLARKIALDHISESANYYSDWKNKEKILFARKAKEGCKSVRNPQSTKVVAVEVLDYGVDHAQYFQGVGTYGTDFDFAVIGAGHSQESALEDAIEQLYGQEHPISSEVENELSKDLKRASKVDEVQKVIESNAPTNKYILNYTNEQGLQFPSEEFETEEDAITELEKILAKNKKYRVDEIGVNSFEIQNDSWPSNRYVSVEENPEYVEYMEEANEYNELYYYVAIRAKLG